MAENKKSFIAYVDWKETFNSLPDEKAGQLIKHLFAYVSDENPVTDDVLINAVFANIKQTLKRDLRKYETIREKRSLAGKASADKRQHVSTCVDRPQQTSTNSTVNDNDNVNVNDSVNDKKKRRKKSSSPFIAPSLEEVKTYFSENGYDPAVGVRAWMGYDAANWFDARGNAILNWKQKMINVWFKPENKKQVRMLA